MVHMGTSAIAAISSPVDHCYTESVIQGKLHPALSRESKSSKKDDISESDTEPEPEQEPGHTCMGMSRQCNVVLLPLKQLKPHKMFDLLFL